MTFCNYAPRLQDGVGRQSEYDCPWRSFLKSIRSTLGQGHPREIAHCSLFKIDAISSTNVQFAPGILQEAHDWSWPIWRDILGSLSWNI